MARLLRNAIVTLALCAMEFGVPAAAHPISHSAVRITVRHHAVARHRSRVSHHAVARHRSRASRHAVARHRSRASHHRRATAGKHRSFATVRVGSSFEPLYFSPTSPWNTPLSNTALVDPNSAALVASLTHLASVATSFNTTRWSVPIYTVPAGQPTVPVIMSASSPGLSAAFSAVPIPAGAQPAAGADEHLVIYQPSTDTMWEMWHAQLLSDGWHAGYGGRILNVSSNPGYYQTILSPSGSPLEEPFWGATATSLPLAAGLITFHDLAAGEIDHAVALAVPQVEANVMVWPAERTDGRSTLPGAIPEGARFRLNPNLNIASLNLPPIVSMIALAAQRYGIIVRDGGSTVGMYGEDPTPTGSMAWTTALGALRPYNVLAKFPWSSLQLVQMTATQLKTK